MTAAKTPKINLCRERHDRSPVGVGINAVSKAYGTQQVLTNISLDIRPGEIFTIMGPSGSGKSVLLRHIAGLETPTEGTVTINGRNPCEPATRDLFALALVFQAGALFNSLTVYENLALYPAEHHICPKNEIHDKVMHALQILSIESAANKIPAELSGGMKKRVAIARALVMEPQVILYDEPTSELDPVMGATIAEIIANLKKNFTVTSIVVSHDRDLALTISDRVAILRHGKLITVDTPEGIRNSTHPFITDFLNPQIDLQNPRFKQLEASNE